MNNELCILEQECRILRTMIESSRIFSNVLFCSTQSQQQKNDTCNYCNVHILQTRCRRGLGIVVGKYYFFHEQSRHYKGFVVK